MRCVWKIPTAPSSYDFCVKCETLLQGGERHAICKIKEIRNGKEIIKRVCPVCKSTEDWVAHFATFGEALVESMIRAGTPKDVCSKCGKPRRKTYKEGKLISSGPNKMAIKPRGFAQNDMIIQDLPKDPWGDMPRREREFIGYTDCGCGGFEPGIVLDPFSGAGTVALVAKKLGRSYVGIELNSDYVRMTNKRLEKVQKELLL